MKKILFLLAVGLTTIVFAQAPTPYPYFSYGRAFVAPAVGVNNTYTVPDPNADSNDKLTITAGLKFNRFDFSKLRDFSLTPVPAQATTPQEDRDKTFANNLATPAITTGTDENRAWVTVGASAAVPVADIPYYSCIRQNSGVGCSIAGAFWAYYTVNFAEATRFNPIVRFRDGVTGTTAPVPNLKENTFTISIFAKTNMTTPLYTQTVSLDGLSTTSVAGNITTDGKAEYLLMNGTTPGQTSSVWYRIIPTFTPPAAGEYVVKIDQAAGTIFTNGLGSFTFWKAATLSTAKFKENNLKVFTKGRILNVNFDSTEEASVSVYDMTGRQVVSKRVVAGSMTAELPAAGIYVVNLESKGTSKATKVVID
jgi:hypothetical protein